jgi:arylsulfatase A-like enzyme
MTGQHCGPTEVRGNKEYWSGNVKYGANDDYAVAGQHPYDTAHVNIAQILKDNGYTTGMFGKWAAGYEGSAYTPDKRGIDEYFGYICQFQAHLYYPNFLNRYSRSKGDKGTVRITLDENIKHPMYGDEYKKRPQYASDIIHREALGWLSSQNSEQPFFGLFTYTLPHAELAQPDDSLLQHYRKIFKEEKEYGGDRWSRYNPTKEAHAQFAAMVTRLDTYMGEILALLEEKGLAENTLVLFTSDNGPHSEGGADPQFFNKNGELRGIKRSMHEGGIRVPFIAYWKSRIAAGTTTDHQCAFYDLMPTFC